MAASLRWKKFFGSKWFLFLGTVLFVFLLLGYGRMYYQNYLVNKEIARLQAEAQKVQAKKLEMLQLLEYAKSPAYVERQAHLQLGLVKNGEHVIVINTPAKKVFSASRQNIDPVVESDEPSNPRLWWKYFFY